MKHLAPPLLTRMPTGLLPLDDGKKLIKTRPRAAGKFAEPEDHRPFILIGDPQASGEEEAK